MDVAGVLTCEKLKIYVKDKLSPILIVPYESEERGFFVVMPMRI